MSDAGVTLTPVTSSPAHVAVLYQILHERPQKACISHERMPTLKEHKAFVAHHPYRVWYLIQVGEEVVGEVNAAWDNSVGISLLAKYRDKGYGGKAMRVFLETHQPAKAIPGQRNGHWLAHIALTNPMAKCFFRDLGFTPLQETWIYAKESPAPSL